jgi:hypothetical protein
MTKARDLGDNAQNTKPKVVNAKADLIVGTGSDAADRLAVGNNGETLVADSSATTGLRYQATKATQNCIINGGFDNWQRGTSFAYNNSQSYNADRWFSIIANTGATVSRQTGTGEFQYVVRLARNSGSTSTPAIGITQPVAIEEATQFAGKTVTLSFYARAGANFSAASSAMSVSFYSGTGSTDTNRANFAYTGDVTVLNTTQVITSTLTRYSFTFTLGSTVTQFQPFFSFTPVGTAGANDWLEITGVQLEVGSVPTTFRRAGGTLAGERSACMRYYQRFNSDQVYAIYASGPARSTTQADFLVPFLVPLRTSPSSSIDYANLGMNAYNGDITRTVTALVENGVNKSPFAAVVTATHAGTNFTQGNIYRLYNDNNASGYLGFSAEL